MLVCGENFTQLMGFIASIRAYFKKNKEVADFFRRNKPAGLELPIPRKDWVKPNTKKMRMRYQSALGRYREEFEAQNRQRQAQEQAEQLQQFQVAGQQGQGSQLEAIMQQRIGNEIDGVTDEMDAMEDAAAGAQDVMTADDLAFIVDDSSDASPAGHPDASPGHRSRRRDVRDESDSDASRDMGVMDMGGDNTGTIPKPYPAAIRMCEVLNFDHTKIKGTGDRCRVTVNDVKRVQAQGKYDM